MNTTGAAGAITFFWCCKNRFIRGRCVRKSNEFSLGARENIGCESTRNKCQGLLDASSVCGAMSEAFAAPDSGAF